MSFGEHLDELRRVLIRSVFGIAIGCIFGFMFATQVVEVMNQPLMEALTTFRQDRAKEHLIKEEGFIAPEFQSWLDKDRLAPQTVRIDPGQLVEALRRVSPDFLAGVKLDPYQFQKSQFEDADLQALCREWRAATEKEADNPQKFLWTLLNAPERSEIRRMESNSEEATAEDIESVLAIFNRLAESIELSDAPAMQPLMAEKKQGFFSFLSKTKPNPLAGVKKQLDEKADVNLNRRLNRVLLSTVFANQVSPVRMDLVPLQIWENIIIRPQSLQPLESFMIWLKAGLIAGLLISSPWVLFQLWSFVAAGLYPHEQRYVYVFLPISLILFFSGAALAFFFVFQPVLAFLFTFDAQMGIEPQPRVNEWLSFVMFLPLGFGVAFQLPLVMLFLNRINVFTVRNYLDKWRIAVMIIFVLSMLLTPADPISMILLAFPLTVLYFLGIGLCQWLPRSKNPFTHLEPPSATPS